MVEDVMVRLGVCVVALIGVLSAAESSAQQRRPGHTFKDLDAIPRTSRVRKYGSPE
jgi:hypothetical protein